MNIAENLEQNRLFFRKKPAVVFEGKEISYAELDAASSRFATGLASFGIGRGDRVALFLPNIPEFCIAYFGVQKLGAVSVSLNVMLKGEEVRFVLDDSGSTAIVTTEEMASTVPLEALPDLKTVIIAEGDAVGGQVALSDVVARGSDDFRAVFMERDDPAAILYTSGTTGFPKGATLSHGNVVSNIYSTVHNCRMVPKDRLHLYLPLFHCFGQNFIMNAGITAGATLIMQRRFVPDEALDAIERHGVTMFFGVPTIFITYLNMEVPPDCFQTVRYFFTAAAIMPPKISAAWKDHYGQNVWEGYGLTETSPFASYNHFFKHKHGSIGTPIENVEMKIVDPEGNSLPAGEMGEIAIKGPNVMLGYWNHEDATSEVIRDGWFHSGDIGMTDEEGYYFICDRIKDMVISAGFNVYPVEVENVIHSRPEVAEVAVYGVADTVKGEVVKATVVLKQGQTLDEEKLIEFCRDKMAHYKVPRVVEFAEQLPKSPTGKILKRVLRGEELKPE